MKILESPLMGEFIGFLKANWGGNSRVNQRRRRLRQLVAMVRGVSDAAEVRVRRVRSGSLNAWLQQLRMEALRGQEVLDATSDASAVVGATKKLLAGVKTLFVCSSEVDLLSQAVEELERLAGPGGDLDLFLKVLQLDVDDDAAMDLDEEEGFGSWGDPDNPATLGGKRKRAGGSDVDGGGGGGYSSSLGQPERGVEWQKRRVLAWRRLPNLGVLSATPAPRRPTAPPRRTRRARSVGQSARTVAMAMVKIQGRIGKQPASRRLQADRTGGMPSLGQRLSLIALQ